MLQTGHRWRAWALLLYAALYVVAALGILAKPLDRRDYWVHMAVVCALAEGKDLGSIPIGNNRAALDRLNDPEHALWAAVMRHTGWKATDVFVAAGLVNLAVLLGGMFFLARSLSRSWIMAACLPAVLLLVWGTGYVWSSEYSYSVLPVFASYPSILAWGLSFSALGLVHRWLCGGGWRWLIVAAALGGLAITVHALTAVIFTLPFPVMWVWLRRVSWRRRIAVCVFPALAILISMLWPHNSLFGQLWTQYQKGARLGGNAIDNCFLLSYGLLPLGPIWAGALFVFWAPRSWRRPLIAGIAVYGLAWIGLSLLGVPLAHRFVFYLAFALHLAIVGALVRGLRGWSEFRSKKSFAQISQMGAAILVLLFIPWAPMQVGRVAAACRHRIAFQTHSFRPSEVARYEESCRLLRKSMPEGEHVMVDERSYRILAAFGVPVVVDGGLIEGRFDALDPDTLEVVKRSAEATGATHFLVDYILLSRSELKPWEQKGIDSLGRVTRLTPDFTLVELRREKE
jgi:hypothetical protein